MRAVPHRENLLKDSFTQLCFLTGTLGVSTSGSPPGVHVDKILRVRLSVGKGWLERLSVTGWVSPVTFWSHLLHRLRVLQVHGGRILVRFLPFYKLNNHLVINTKTYFGPLNGRGVRPYPWTFHPPFSVGSDLRVET